MQTRSAKWLHKTGKRRTQWVKIIGISGKAGSGKDHLGRLLRRFGYQNVAFAWPLKLEGIALGFSYEEVFDTKPPQVRTWLQEQGMWRRQQDQDYWVRQLHGLITVLNKQGGIPNFVITDMRFPNEFAFVRNHGGKVIRLAHGDRNYPLAGTLAASHASETALDGPFVKWDLKITNGLDMTDERLRIALYAAGLVDSRPLSLRSGE